MGMRKIKSQVNLFSYKDYRDFLTDKIKERKERKLNASFRWLASKAGFTSPNFIHLVISKKRHLSGDSIEKMAALFELTKPEAKYFRSLISFNKAKTPSEKEHYANEIISQTAFKNEFPLSRDQFEYYSQWYHIPIREMLTLANQSYSAQDISNIITPTVSTDDVSNALTLLGRLGLVKKNDLRFEVHEQSIQTGENVSNYGVIAYHKKMMQLGAESLDRFPSQQREVSSVTIGLSENNFKKVKQMIVDFRSQLMQISESDQDRDEIYQFNFQVFPLSRRKEKR